MSSAIGSEGSNVVAAERALLFAMGDREWEVRCQAAKSLGRLGNPATAPVLAEAMPDPSWWVRLNCAEALVGLGEVGRAQLIRLTGHVDPYVREQAAATLEIYEVRGEGRPGPRKATTIASVTA